MISLHPYTWPLRVKIAVALGALWLAVTGFFYERWRSAERRAAVYASAVESASERIRELETELERVKSELEKAARFSTELQYCENRLRVCQLIVGGWRRTDKPAPNQSRSGEPEIVGVLRERLSRTY